MDNGVGMRLRCAGDIRLPGFMRLCSTRKLLQFVDLFKEADKARESVGEKSQAHKEEGS
jgi:hypothetical protein